MRIFIGSSQKQIIGNNTEKQFCNLRTREQEAIISNSIPGKLVKALRAKEYDVKPWWEDDTLKILDYFLESLINLSEFCDAGIFILGKDDEFGKGVNNKKYMVGDNVLIEYGMFVAKKGKENSYLIRETGEKEGNPCLPTNFAGLKLPELDDEAVTKAVDYFSRLDNKKHSLSRMTFFVNTKLSESIHDKSFQETKPRRNWSTKTLFVGSESARKWEEIETSPKYMGNDTENVIRTFISKCNEKSKKDDCPPEKVFHINKIENIISLGPGVGKSDSDVISKIYETNKLIKYIPVDINHHLAYLAAKRISGGNPFLKIPFAIIENFEREEDNLVSLILNDKKGLKARRNLLLMLGGTFVNIQVHEENFLKQVVSWMSKEDFFLLDVYIKDDSYDVEMDTKTKIKKLPNEYKDFIINGILKKYLGTEKLPKDVLSRNNLFNYVQPQIIYKNAFPDLRKDYTKLDKTAVLIYKYNKDGHIVEEKEISGEELFVAKRYDYFQFKELLGVYFHVIYDSIEFKEQEKENTMIIDEIDKDHGSTSEKRCAFLLRTKH